MDQSHHLLLCHATDISSSLNSFFKFFLFSKFNIPSQKSDKNDSTKIVLIKIILKINIIKIYIEYTHLITIKYGITRTFIKVEYIFIFKKSSKKFLNHFTCNKPIGNKFQCCNHKQNHHTFF